MDIENQKTTSERNESELAAIKANVQSMQDAMIDVMLKTNQLLGGEK
jgi:hypothetical protein